MKNYYQLSQNEVRREVNGKEEALTSSEVQQNQEKYGLNELVEGKKEKYDSDISGAVQGFPCHYFDCCSSRIGDTWRCRECNCYFDRNY